MAALIAASAAPLAVGGRRREICAPGRRGRAVDGRVLCSGGRARCSMSSGTGFGHVASASRWRIGSVRFVMHWRARGGLLNTLGADGLFPTVAEAVQARQNGGKGG